MLQNTNATVLSVDTIYSNTITDVGIQTALTATVLRSQQNDSNRFLDLLARVQFQLARCKGKVEPPHMAHGQSKLGAQEFLRMASNVWAGLGGFLCNFSS